MIKISKILEFSSKLEQAQGNSFLTAELNNGSIVYYRNVRYKRTTFQVNFPNGNQRTFSEGCKFPVKYREVIKQILNHFEQKEENKMSNLSKTLLGKELLPFSKLTKLFKLSKDNSEVLSVQIVHVYEHGNKVVLNLSTENPNVINAETHGLEAQTGYFRTEKEAQKNSNHFEFQRLSKLENNQREFIRKREREIAILKVKLAEEIEKLSSIIQKKESLK